MASETGEEKWTAEEVIQIRLPAYLNTPIPDYDLTVADLARLGIPHYYGTTSRLEKDLEQEGFVWASSSRKRPTYLWANGDKIFWSTLRDRMGFKMVVLDESLNNPNVRLSEGTLHRCYEHLPFGVLRGWRENDMGRIANFGDFRVYRLFVAYSLKLYRLLRERIVIINYPESLVAK
jgi:hypothetical protein